MDSSRKAQSNMSKPKQELLFASERQWVLKFVFILCALSCASVALLHTSEFEDDMLLHHNEFTEGDEPDHQYAGHWDDHQRQKRRAMLVRPGTDPRISEGSQQQPSREVSQQQPSGFSGTDPRISEDSRAPPKFLPRTLPPAFRGPASTNKAIDPLPPAKSGPSTPVKTATPVKPPGLPPINQKPPSTPSKATNQPPSTPSKAYHIVGSWDDWVINKDPMAGPKGGPVRHRITMGKKVAPQNGRQREEFQILGDGSWHKRIYPSGGDNEEVVVLKPGGPATPAGNANSDPEKGHGRNFAVEGNPGDIFDIILDVQKQMVACEVIRKGPPPKPTLPAFR